MKDPGGSVHADNLPRIPSLRPGGCADVPEHTAHARTHTHTHTHTHTLILLIWIRSSTRTAAQRHRTTSHSFIPIVFRKGWECFSDAGTRPGRQRRAHPHPPHLPRTISQGPTSPVFSSSCSSPWQGAHGPRSQGVWGCQPPPQNLPSGYRRKALSQSGQSSLSLGSPQLQRCRLEPPRPDWQGR